MKTRMGRILGWGSLQHCRSLANGLYDRCGHYVELKLTFPKFHFETEAKVISYQCASNKGIISSNQS